MTSNLDIPEDAVLIGRLGRTFQLHGGLRFYGLGPAEGEAVRKLSRVFVEGLGFRRLERVRSVGAQTVVYLSDVRVIEAAKPLVNHEVYALRDELPDAGEADFYIDLILGLPVTLEGEPFGKVVEVLSAGGQELLVIEAEGGEHMVPLRADYVKLGAEGVEIQGAPEGLLELS